MTKATYALHQSGDDAAPGDDATPGSDRMSLLAVYLVGFGLAVFPTVVSFTITRAGLVWRPSVPVAISVLAVAQMGVHLVFFLHITTGRDSANTIMALAFGVLIVMLLVLGSLWIMGHLDRNMMPTDALMKMQR